MDVSINNLNNVEVSTFPPEMKRNGIIISLIFFAASILGIFILISLGASLELAMLMSLPTGFLVIMYFLVLMKTLNKLPNRVIITDKTLDIFINKKEMNLAYDDLIEIYPYAYQRDKVGNPDTRWVAAFRHGIISLQIHLKEENARKLSEHLINTNIRHKWNNEWK